MPTTYPARHGGCLELTSDARSFDRTLATAALAGEASARRLVWLRMSPVVRRTLRRFKSRFLEEDDLVQEVFLSLFRNLPSLREPEALREFVIGIAVRTARYHARRALRRWQFEFPTDLGQLTQEPTAPEDVPVQHAVMRFESLLPQVRERDRAAFVLRYVNGMGAQEVAAILGISVATARRRYSRARERLCGLAECDPFLTTYVWRSASAGCER